MWIIASVAFAVRAPCAVNEYLTGSEIIESVEALRAASYGVNIGAADMVCAAGTAQSALSFQI